MAGQIFPETVGRLIQPTKQGIFFFGPPAGDLRFTDAHLPVWGDHGKRFFYGIPGSGRRGFKVADDTRGSAFDPTTGERMVSQATLKRVREYLAFRFPAMKDAPLIETRVCQYEQTPDSNFIVDRHPRMENVWLLGGGSGHGFKHGPALGELMAELIVKDGERQMPFGGCQGFETTETSRAHSFDFAPGRLQPECFTLCSPCHLWLSR